MNRSLLRLFFILIFLIGLGFFVHSPIFAKNGEHAQPHKALCATAEKDGVRCNARVIVDAGGKPVTNATPTGYGPNQFLSAYNLSGTSSSNQTIAIVDAYNDPNIFSDLNTFSTQFGIPTMKSCPVSSGTTSSPCFQKVNQNGGTNYPKTNSGWALEISLDVEMAHAMCQTCNILLVEASSASYTNLMTAVDRARIMGAKIISNSYGSGEFSGETFYDAHFNYPGIVFTFSSGDSGYGAQYPASSPYVTAVAGTTLSLNGNSYGSETVWNGTGSGCSAFETVKPAGQPTIAGCTNRIVADVAADADPNTGAAIYDSVPYSGQSGWFQVGGTSLSAPLIAGVYALSGGVPSASFANTLPYSQYNYATNIHDVTIGSTLGCDGTALCTARVGYDGPTGLGTPNGAGAF